MSDPFLPGAAAWGLPFFLGALHGTRPWRAAVWASAGGLVLGAALVRGAAGPWDAGGLALAWLCATAAPCLMRASRRRSEARFRARLRALRRPAGEAAAEESAERAVLSDLRGHLERIQSRFTLFQAMVTQLDTRRILRSLGELWSGIPQVSRCALFQPLPNGNWVSVFSHGVERPEAWAAFLNENVFPSRPRRLRRFDDPARHPELASLGAGTPFMLMPFVWGDDVMALGALELDPASGEDVLDGFQVERKLVSIGLRRAFLYDLMSERGRHDGLTGALLRRPFLERVEEALRKRQRYRVPFALGLLDVDHFKEVNDRHGHLAGDRALVHLAQTARRLTVPGVTLGRLGGDEFALLLELPDFQRSLSWAEGFREEVRRAKLKEDAASFSITLSIGLAEAPADRVSVEELIQRADGALYAAKNEGRDRMVSLPAVA